MPTAMAGSRGGLVRGALGLEGPEFIRRLLQGDVALEELHERLSSYPCPQNVSLVVNNACNLQCRHCYLQVKELTGRPLTDDEWKLLIDSIMTVGPELICLSGKEVFLGTTGINLLEYLGDLNRSSAAACRIGVITNGTLVQRHRDSIERAQPSYFDISLDGVEKDHDAIRGQGAFAAAIPNIDWGVQTFGNQFFVSLTLQKQNFQHLGAAVSFLAQRGVQNIACGFYRPLSYTDPTLALAEPDIDFVFECLNGLEQLNLQNPPTILFDFDMVSPQPLRAFLSSTWFDMDKIQQDLNGECYVEHLLRNGLRLELRFAPYPTGVWRSLRITAEGNYLAAEDTIDTTRYKECTIANVRDFGFEFGALHRHALASNRFRQILRQYYETELPELIASCHANRLLYS